MNTWRNHDDTVIITIDGNVAENDAGDPNIAPPTYTFQADNRAPRVLDAEVDGRELTVTFDEALDEGAIPLIGDFLVSVTRDGVFGTERVSRVAVDATEVILTLARAVRFGDAVDLSYDYAVDLSYDYAGARSLRDRVGNRASRFDLRVRNNTDEGEAPGPPRSLTAVADGASVIELNWRSPLSSGSSAITGYSDRGVDAREPA